MTRRSNEVGYRYEYSKSGAFGCFKSINTEPVEYLLTSFKMGDLHRLTYARDLQTELNFEYLIQRDIDEERALAEISQYIASGEGHKQSEVVFLPPILVAIVDSDNKNNIKSSYTPCSFSEEADSHGEVFTREWPGVFKMENYGITSGINHHFSHDKGNDTRIFDGEQAKLHLNLTPKDSAGAKLVVIDGQHRLFAMNYLQQNEPEKIEGLTIPVCIIYPPNSTIDNVDTDSFLKVPDVLRSLFVDVNSTVERVSGHFLTLLSDETLGSLICRDFCKTVLSELGDKSLGLVEWNTKNHKQSLEISREHTITSIGVINSSLEENFRTKSGAKLLSEILEIDSEEHSFDFGENEYDEQVGLPSGFPWTGFNIKHKDILLTLVEKNFTPNLIKIFFETTPYVDAKNLFSEMLDEKEALLKSARSSEYGCFSSVKSHLLFNDPISKSDKTSQRLLFEFISDYKERRKDLLPAIFRMSILQKSIIDTWTFLLQKLLPYSISITQITEITVTLIESSVKSTSNLFDLSNLYLQDTIYNGTRIKVTKSAKKQLVRLLVSQLGNNEVLSSVIASAQLPETLSPVLRKIAEVEVGGFYKAMKEDKRKVFLKDYKTNFSIPTVDRERLILTETKLAEKVILDESNDSRIQAELEFNEIMNKYLNEELVLSADNLVQNLKFNELFLYSEEEMEDET